MVQEEFAANWLPQLSTAVKSRFPAALVTEVPMPVSGKPPLLVIVTVIGVALCPTTVAGNVRLVVDSVSVAPSNPVPLSAADCVPRLSVTVKLPVADPACVGAKSTATAQADPAAKEPPQVSFVFTKGAVTTIPLRETGLPPTFCRLRVCAAEVVPTCCVPKLRLVGSSVRLPVANPVPVSGTSSSPPATLALIAIVPLRLPVSVGVKLTVNWQLAFFATVVPAQLSVSL
jgi:hypothetical protein